MNDIKSMLVNLPTELVDVLQIEFQKLHQQYFLGKWELTQLDAGRFAEVIFRILEYKKDNHYTPIGSQIDRLKIYNSISNSTLDESLRIHVLKLADHILDFRNKRNVGHIGKIIVNEIDSNLVLQIANWIISELIRNETQLNSKDIQEEVKKIIERKVPIIEEIGGNLKCLEPSLTASDKTLVCCYQKYPTAILLDDLIKWIGYSNKTTLRKQLVKLDKNGYIDFKENSLLLTKRGLLWVEKYIKFELEI